jgi:hypothetical protein
LVQGIQASEPLHVEFQDGRKLTGTVSSTDDKIQIATPGASPVEAPVTSVQSLRNDAEEKTYEKSLHPGLFDGWKTGLNAGFALTRGNSETKNLSIGFLAARQTLHDKLGLYANSVYATNDAAGAIPSTTANTAGGGLRYDHDLRPRIFAFGAADFFSDGLQGLNIRSVFGGGGGYHAIKNDNTTLDLLAGLNYTHESYTGLTRNFAALTLGEELMHKLGKSPVLNESLAFFPDLNDLGEYRGHVCFWHRDQNEQMAGLAEFIFRHLRNQPASGQKTERHHPDNGAERYVGPVIVCECVYPPDLSQRYPGLSSQRYTCV